MSSSCTFENFESLMPVQNWLFMLWVLLESVNHQKNEDNQLPIFRARPVVPLSVKDRIPKSLLWQKDIEVCHWLSGFGWQLLLVVTRTFYLPPKATLHVQTSDVIPQQLFPNTPKLTNIWSCEVLNFPVTTGTVFVVPNIELRKKRGCKKDI